MEPSLKRQKISGVADDPNDDLVVLEPPAISAPASIQPPSDPAAIAVPGASDASALPSESQPPVVKAETLEGGASMPTTPKLSTMKRSDSTPTMRLREHRTTPDYAALAAGRGSGVEKLSDISELRRHAIELKQTELDDIVQQRTHLLKELAGLQLDEDILDLYLPGTEAKLERKMQAYNNRVHFEDILAKLDIPKAPKEGERTPIPRSPSITSPRHTRSGRLDRSSSSSSALGLGSAQGTQAFGSVKLTPGTPAALKLTPAEQAKRDGEVMARYESLMRAGELLEKLVVPSREKDTPRGESHQDILISEMRWLSEDFRQERKWKVSVAKKVARAVVRHFEDKRLEQQRGVANKEAALRRRAATIAKMVRKFWTKIEEVVQHRQARRLEAVKQTANQQRQAQMLGVAEQYSTMLARELKAAEAPSRSASRSGTPAVGPDKGKGKQVSPQEPSPDDRTGLEPGDNSFIPVEEDPQDDERTMEEDADADNIDPADEAALLAQEADLSIEELLKRAGYIQDEEAQAPSSHEGEKDGSGQDGSGSSSAPPAVEESSSSAPAPEAVSTPAQGSTNGMGASAEVQQEPPAEQESTMADLLIQDGDKLSKSEEVAVSRRRARRRPPPTDDEEGDNVPRDSSKEESMRLINAASAEASTVAPTGATVEDAEVRRKAPFLLKHTLREYQLVGMDWLASMYEKKLNGILADEMGLGKTMQTIALLAWLAVERHIWGPHLIVVPTSVMLNWEMELKKWCPAFKILTYYGSVKERRQKRMGWSKPNAFHVCITSYKLAVQDHQAFRRKKWKYFILDEAQNIKNFKSQRWQVMLGFNSKRRILLTGTPLQNSLMELWALLHFLMPQVFTSHTEFREWFANPITGMIEGTEEVQDKVITRLHSILRPFLLRRLKADVEKQLPAKVEHVVMCSLSQRQRALYDEYMARAEIRRTLTTGNFLGIVNVLMQLRKVCNHPDLFEPRPIISPLAPPSFPGSGVQHGALQFKAPSDIFAGTTPAVIVRRARSRSSIARSKEWKGTAIHHRKVFGVPWGSAVLLDNTEMEQDKGIAGQRQTPDSIGWLNVNGTGTARDEWRLRVSFRCLNFLLSEMELNSHDNCSSAGIHTGAYGAMPGPCPPSPIGLCPRGLSWNARRRSELTPPVRLIEELDEEGNGVLQATATGTIAPVGLAVLPSSASHALPGQAPVIEAQKRYRRSVLARIAAVNARRCAAVPVYGPELIQLVIRMSAPWEWGAQGVNVSGSQSRLWTLAMPYNGRSHVLSRGCTHPDPTDKRIPWGLGSGPPCPRSHSSLAHAEANAMNTPSIVGTDTFNEPQFLRVRGLTRAVCDMVVTPEDRTKRMRDTLQSFTCRQPPVLAPPVEAVVSHLNRTEGRNLDCLTSDFHRSVWTPITTSCREVEVRSQMIFPDKRLLQYDCGKLQTLAKLLRELKSGKHRVLIFTQMTRMLDVLEEFLNYHGHTYLRLDGATRVESRQLLMERFNTDERVFVFILSTRSGGLGMNLTGADTVIFYDSDWNPAMDAQAQDRAHRIGQTRNVHIYRLVAERTVEENILKKAMQKRTLEHVAIDQAAFTTDFFKAIDLREFFQDDEAAPEPVEEARAPMAVDKTPPVQTPAAGDSDKAQVVVSRTEWEQALASAEDETDVAAMRRAAREQAQQDDEFGDTFADAGLESSNEAAGSSTKQTPKTDKSVAETNTTTSTTTVTASQVDPAAGVGLSPKKSAVVPSPVSATPPAFTSSARPTAPETDAEASDSTTAARAPETKEMTQQKNSILTALEKEHAMEEGVAIDTQLTPEAEEALLEAQLLPIERFALHYTEKLSDEAEKELKESLEAEAAAERQRFEEDQLLDMRDDSSDDDNDALTYAVEDRGLIEATYRERVAQAHGEATSLGFFGDPVPPPADDAVVVVGPPQLEEVRPVGDIPPGAPTSPDGLFASPLIPTEEVPVPVKKVPASHPRPKTELGPRKRKLTARQQRKLEGDRERAERAEKERQIRLDRQAKKVGATHRGPKVPLTQQFNLPDLVEPPPPISHESYLSLLSREQTKKVMDWARQAKVTNDDFGKVLMFAHTQAKKMYHDALQNAVTLLPADGKKGKKRTAKQPSDHRLAVSRHARTVLPASMAALESSSMSTAAEGKKAFVEFTMKVVRAYVDRMKTKLLEVEAEAKSEPRVVVAPHPHGPDPHPVVPWTSDETRILLQAVALFSKYSKGAKSIDDVCSLVEWKLLLDVLHANARLPGQRHRRTPVSCRNQLIHITEGDMNKFSNMMAQALAPTETWDHAKEVRSAMNSVVPLMKSNSRFTPLAGGSAGRVDLLPLDSEPVTAMMDMIAPATPPGDPSGPSDTDAHMPDLELPLHARISLGDRWATQLMGAHTLAGARSRAVLLMSSLAQPIKRTSVGSGRVRSARKSVNRAVRRLYAASARKNPNERSAVELARRAFAARERRQAGHKSWRVFRTNMARYAGRPIGGAPEPFSQILHPLRDVRLPHSWPDNYARYLMVHRQRAALAAQRGRAHPGQAAKTASHATARQRISVAGVAGSGSVAHASRGVQPQPRLHPARPSQPHPASARPTASAPVSQRAPGGAPFGLLAPVPNPSPPQQPASKRRRVATSRASSHRPGVSQSQVPALNASVPTPAMVMPQDQAAIPRTVPYGYPIGSITTASRAAMAYPQPMMSLTTAPPTVAPPRRAPLTTSTLTAPELILPRAGAGARPAPKKS